MKHIKIVLSDAEHKVSEGKEQHYKKVVTLAGELASKNIHFYFTGQVPASLRALIINPKNKMKNVHVLIPNRVNAFHLVESTNNPADVAKVFEDEMNNANGIKLAVRQAELAAQKAAEKAAEKAAAEAKHLAERQIIVHPENDQIQKERLHAENEARLDKIIEIAGQRAKAHTNELKAYVNYAISVLTLNGHMPKSYSKDWKAAKDGVSEEAQALANVKKLAHNYSAHRIFHWGRKHTKVAKQLEHFVKDLQKNDDLSDETKLHQLESKLMELANVVREGKINVSGSMGRRVMFSLANVLALTQKDVTKAVEAKADKTADAEAEAKAAATVSL